MTPRSFFGGLWRALDGLRKVLHMIVLLVIEGILRRDLNQEFKERIYQVAFVVLILFAAFVMFNDVTKLPIFSKLKP